MDRKFILIPALAGGIFLAQSAQQRAEALSAPTVTIGQTSNPQTSNPMLNARALGRARRVRIWWGLGPARLWRRLG